MQQPPPPPTQIPVQSCPALSPSTSTSTSTSNLYPNHPVTTPLPILKLPLSLPPRTSLPSLPLNLTAASYSPNDFCDDYCRSPIYRHTLVPEAEAGPLPFARSSQHFRQCRDPWRSKAKIHDNQFDNHDYSLVSIAESDIPYILHDSRSLIKGSNPSRAKKRPHDVLMV